MDRFFAPLDDDLIELPEGEAHHLRHVLRKQPGDRVILFDGQGGEADGVVQAVDRKSVRVAVHDRRRQGARSTEVIVAAAVPKGERFKWMVEKLTELGVSRLIPLRTARSVVAPGQNRLERLEPLIISACKQCGRNDLMHVDDVREWPELLSQISPGAVALLGDPAGGDLREAFASLTSPPAQVLILIGPEGGFTPAEVDAAVAAGARPIRLGEFVLRVETAAIALAATALGAISTPTATPGNPPLP